MGNLLKALFTIAAITTVSASTVTTTSLAKAEVTVLTQITPGSQPQSGSQNTSGTATVTADTKMYSDPGTNYNVVTTLSQGSMVEILDSVSKGNATWYRVVGESKKDMNYRDEGWVQGDYLSFIAQPPSSNQSGGRVVALIEDTRAFSGPGTDYVVSAFLARGSKVEILDSVSKGDTTWYKVGGEYGYDNYRGAGWVQDRSLGLSSQPSSGGQSAGGTATTDLIFQTSNYAVRVYRQGEQTLMNVFDKRDGVTFLRGTPVKVEPNPEGYNYANTSGEVKVKVFQSRNSNTHSIQVGNSSPELSL